MTIASEIEDLTTNLANAKNMVTSKGGTVGDTGLSGLALEIASIPTGGATWGTLTYLDNDNVEHEVTIQDESEYLSLANNQSEDITVGGQTFNNKRIKTVALGAKAGYAPGSFLQNCTLLTTITGVENIMVCGASFLSGCTSLDCTLNFEELIIIQGSSFLGNCSSLNHLVSLPKITQIESHFMDGCTSYAQSFTFPPSCRSTGNYCMYNVKKLTSIICNTDVTYFYNDNRSFATNDSNAIMYTTGITVTGTYASDFKNTFADSTSSPYRKIILGV